MIWHIPVLKKEIIGTACKYIFSKERTLFIDCTIGDAGHSLSLLSAFPQAKILGLDRDLQMLSRAEKRIGQSGISLEKILIEKILMEKISIEKASSEKESVDSISHLQKEKPFSLDSSIGLCRCSYHEIGAFLKKYSLRPALILLDLGASLYHFKEASRGFSYLDSALDMRFDSARGQPALQVVNYYSQKELSRIFQEYGEEPFARRIAKAIIKERPFFSAKNLAESIRKNLGPFKKKGSRIHPAARVFQALRIITNDELNILKAALQELPFLLGPKGLLIVISFHSLEDRIVKQRFRELGVLEKKKNAKEADFLILTPHPVRPSLEEIQENPAARSARMRILFAQRGT